MTRPEKNCCDGVILGRKIEKKFKLWGLKQELLWHDTKCTGKSVINAIGMEMLEMHKQLVECLN